MKKLDVVIREIFFMAVIIILCKVTSMVLTQVNISPIVPDPPQLGVVTNSDDNVPASTTTTSPSTKTTAPASHEKYGSSGKRKKLDRFCVNEPVVKNRE